MSKPPLPIGVPFTPSFVSGSSHSFSEGEIASLGFTPCATTPPGTPEPPPSTGFWDIAGQKLLDYVTLWIYKKLSYLIIIGALNGWDED